MTYGQWSEISGVLVEPGATWTEPFNELQFKIVSRCESVGPQSFSAAVFLDRFEILRTQAFPDKGMAAKAARNQLIELVAGLLRKS